MPIISRLNIQQRISSVVAWDDGPPDNESFTCNVLYTNRTKLILSGKFEGIPENLIINAVSWMLLLGLFTLLRKRAWDYGRIALVHKSEQRWTQLFYGDGSAIRLAGVENASVDPVDQALHQDKGIFSWIKVVFTLKDKDILEKSGKDALQYLSFQRHIMLYLLIICVLSLGMILPVNYSGNLMDKSLFGRTTLSNLDPGSNLLWVHIGLSFFFVPLGIAVMKHFSVKLKFDKEEGSIVSRTLIVTGIPKTNCDKGRLLQHFHEAYENCAVIELQIAYDVKELIALEKERDTALRAKMFCEAISKERGEKLTMPPYHCGRVCFCLHSQQVDAFEYFNTHAQNLSVEVHRARGISLAKPLGIAFVTFETEKMAEIVYKDYQKKCSCRGHPLSSSLSSQLKPANWTVNFAPSPEDIFWENLAGRTRFWYIKAIAIGTGVFILFFMFTTPTIILNYFEFIGPILPKQFVRESPIISEFLSTLVLLLISVLLPVVVRFSVNYLSLWTRSERNYSIMMSTFIFLLFMVVILPLFQLTSVRAFIEWISQKNQSYRWKCVFISGNGAFFVNYVITASFIGTVLELIRFSELFMYVICVCYSRTPAEQAGLRNAVLWEFEFGVQYAWFLLIFSVVIIYSLVCPIIVPFGLLYMVAKHFVDRHNIFFVYGPSKINQNIHATAIHFVIASIILMQLCLFSFLLLRNGLTLMTTTSLIICLGTSMLFLAQMSLHWFQQLSPIAYKNFTRRTSVPAAVLVEDITPTSTDEVHHIGIYLPMVLRRSDRAELLIINPQDRSYGTNEDSIAATPNEEDHGVPMDGATSEEYHHGATLEEYHHGATSEKYHRFATSEEHHHGATLEEHHQRF